MNGEEGVLFRNFRMATPPPSFPPFSRSRGLSKGPPALNKDEHRINERIRVPQVRLIDEQGEALGIVPTYEALRLARERGLDLMEVSPQAQPPVCKICDYGKFKYEKKKKEHRARQKQTIIKVKEVQLRPNTEQHDLDYKFKNARQFLIDGDRVKIAITFRGREVAYADQGYKVLAKLTDFVQDVGMVESPAKLEGKKMILVLAPAPQKAQKVSVVKPSQKSGGILGGE